MKKVRVGIVGGVGYTGGELLRLLVNHRGSEITYVASESSAQKRVAEVFPNLRVEPGLTFQVYDRKKIISACDIVFLAKPQPNSFVSVRDLFGKVRLIDLSGDFRFPAAPDFELWYRTKHLAPEFLPKSVYGLPEIFASEIKTAALVANPGCYPTGIILALTPLVKHGWIEPEVSVSAVSGFSGAGRTPSPNSMAYSVCDNIRPYRVGVHPHAGEVIMAVRKAAGKEVRLSFVPQVAGFERGILSVTFVRLRKKIAARDIAELYRRSYRRCPFVRLYEPGMFPEIRNVVLTNFCDIGWQLVNERDLIVITALDNLVKGAAGQAIQNLNLMAGFPEPTGLA